MHSVSGGRLWTLVPRDHSDEEPMRIIESSACSDPASERIRLIADVKKRTATGKTFQCTEYALSTNGCKLVFELPTGSKYVDYRQLMLYGILVGNERRIQLYKITK